MSFPAEPMIISSDEILDSDIIIEDRKLVVKQGENEVSTKDSNVATTTSFYFKLIHSLANSIFDKEQEEQLAWNSDTYKMATEKIINLVTKSKTKSGTTSASAGAGAGASSKSHDTTITRKRFIWSRQFPEPHYMVMTRTQTINKLASDLSCQIRILKARSDQSTATATAAATTTSVTAAAAAASTAASATTASTISTTSVASAKKAIEPTTSHNQPQPLVKGVIKEVHTSSDDETRVLQEQQKKSRNRYRRYAHKCILKVIRSMQRRNMSAYKAILLLNQPLLLVLPSKQQPLTDTTRNTAVDQATEVSEDVVMTNPLSDQHQEQQQQHGDTMTQQPPPPIQKQQQVVVTESEMERRIRLQIRHRFLAYLRTIANTNSNFSSNNKANRKKQLDIMVQFANALLSMWELPKISLTLSLLSSTATSLSTVSKIRKKEKLLASKGVDSTQWMEVDTEGTTTTMKSKTKRYNSNKRKQKVVVEEDEQQEIQIMGKWTRDERIAFLEGYTVHGASQWKQIAAYVPTRTPTQVSAYGRSVMKRFRITHSQSDNEMKEEKLRAFLLRPDDLTCNNDNIMEDE